MIEAEPSSPLAMDLAGLIVVIISDVDGLCDDLKERQHGLPAHSPAWDAIMSMRLKAATLRGTAWNAAAVITALKAGMRTETMPVARPLVKLPREVETQPALFADVRMRQAGDHSFEDDGEEARA
jgi:hypothetical protein